MKLIKCSDFGINCEWEASGSDEEELIRRTYQHGQDQHAIVTPLDEDFREKVRSKFRPLSDQNAA